MTLTREAVNDLDMWQYLASNCGWLCLPASFTSSKTILYKISKKSAIKQATCWPIVTLGEEVAVEEGAVTATTTVHVHNNVRDFRPPAHQAPPLATSHQHACLRITPSRIAPSTTETTSLTRLPRTSTTARSLSRAGHNSKKPHSTLAAPSFRSSAPLFYGSCHPHLNSTLPVSQISLYANVGTQCRQLHSACATEF